MSDPRVRATPSTTTTLHVLLDGVVAGEVTRRPGGVLRFAYRREYRARSDATPLSLAMPVGVVQHADHVVRPWLAGLMPENGTVLEAWGRLHGVTSRSPFALLSTPVAEDCPGSVRLVPPDRLDAALSGDGAVEWLDQSTLAAMLDDLAAMPTSSNHRPAPGRFTLAGSRPKLAVVWRQGRAGLAEGAWGSTHIIKAAPAGQVDGLVNEHLCLAAARAAGLITARTRLVEVAGRTALLVGRYDRRREGDALVRVHQEDLCQALALDPARKHQTDGGPGVAEVAALVRGLLDPTTAAEVLGDFLDALIWNWLVAGTNAHAKNHSLMLAADQARLAPLYAVRSALTQGGRERDMRFAMRIGGSYHAQIDRDPWPRVAAETGTDPGELRQRARDLALRAPDALADAAAEDSVVALGGGFPRRLVDLVAARCTHALRVLE